MIREEERTLAITKILIIGKTFKALGKKLILVKNIMRSIRKLSNLSGKHN